ncbi:MAG: hypothetical protein ACFFB7_05040, partial [Candidatus Sifarchaeia archaeon]
MAKLFEHRRVLTNSIRMLAEFRNVKHTSQGMIILGILGMVLVSPTLALDTQGFYWEVQAKDYDFFIVSDSFSGSFSGSFYMRVTSEAPVMGTITSWSQIPTVGLQMLWPNGTPFDIAETVFDGLDPIDNRMAVPTGNWALLGELIEPVLVGEELVEDALCWGIIWKQNTSENEERWTSVHYSKSDGFLAEYVREDSNSATDTRTSHVKVIRQDLQS